MSEEPAKGGNLTKEEDLRNRVSTQVESGNQTSVVKQEESGLDNSSQGTHFFCKFSLSITSATAVMKWR